jgi:SAM-dependent methyltransferase
MTPASTTTPATTTSGEVPPRAPDVPYEPSPDHVVTQMMLLARLVSGDVLYDLGCGDGRIVIAAVKQHGVRGVCVDIDPVRIAESRENARRAGVDDRITFLTQDLFKTDIHDATVVTLFLWPKVNLDLRPKLFRELRPGTRVISYMHDMGDWAPDETVPVHSGTRDTAVYLWRMPER